MRLIIKELKVETVLVDFVNNWNKNDVSGEYYKLEIETIYDDLASEENYNGELFSITMDKENNCLILEIDSHFEAFPISSPQPFEPSTSDKRRQTHCTAKIYQS